jgi:hypothetical protein
MRLWVMAFGLLFAIGVGAAHACPSMKTAQSDGTVVAQGESSNAPMTRYIPPSQQGG